MSDLETTPLQNSLVFCPRCLTENDKSALVARMRAQQAERGDEKAVLIARCIGCELAIPLIVLGDDKVEAFDVDPYKDVEQATIAPDALPPAPVAQSDDAAYDRYQVGQAAFQEED